MPLRLKPYNVRRFCTIDAAASVRRKKNRSFKRNLCRYRLIGVNNSKFVRSVPIIYNIPNAIARHVIYIVWLYRRGIYTFVYILLQREDLNAYL